MSMYRVSLLYLICLLFWLHIFWVCICMVELLSRVPYYHQLTLIQDGCFPHFTGKKKTLMDSWMMVWRWNLAVRVAVKHSCKLSLLLWLQLHFVVLLNLSSSSVQKNTRFLLEIFLINIEFCIKTVSESLCFNDKVWPLVMRVSFNFLH